MPDPDKWIIQNNSGSPATGNDLNGFLIKKTASGDYELYGVLARKLSNPSFPFSFPSFNHHGHTWTIGVTSLPVDPTANGSGSWHAVTDGAEGTTPEDGSYTAQAGGGMDEDEDADDAASSATA